MIKYQDENKIIHEFATIQEINTINGVTAEPTAGDLEKYSIESQLSMQGKTYMWYKGFATSFDPNTMYIVEYLTGNYIGVGVDNKKPINKLYISGLEVTTND